MLNFKVKGLDVSLNIYHFFLVVVVVGGRMLFSSLGELPRSNKMPFYNRIAQFTSHGMNQNKYKL